jgi:hypothetical protein
MLPNTPRQETARFAHSTHLGSVIPLSTSEAWEIVSGRVVEALAAIRE